MNDPFPLPARLHTLSDVVRLRMLRLLREHEMSVGELARALQLPQSTVSRHLKLLHEGDWIAKRAQGTASLYRLSEEALDPSARALWTLAREQMAAAPALEEDDARLEEVLAERRVDSRMFFGRVGGEWDDLRRELFGGGAAEEALLGLIPADWTIADLGCGTGNAAELLAPLVKGIIAVDREPAMLEAMRTRLADRSNVHYRQGDLEALPVRDEEIDAAVVLLVLHHLPDPQRAIDEIRRCLKPGGVALVVDMIRHDRESYRQTMGHQHLGFGEDDVRAWAKRARLSLVRYRRLPVDTSGKGPPLFAAALRKQVDG